MDSACTGPSLLTKSLAQIDLPTALLGLSHAESLLPPKSYLRFELLVSICSLLQFEFALFVLDLLHLDSSPLLRGVLCCDVFVPVLNSASLGSMPLPRSFCHAGLAVSLASAVRLGFEMLVLSHGLPEAFLSSKSSGCSESQLLTLSLSRPDLSVMLLDPMHFDTPPSIQTSVYPDLLVSAASSTRFGPSLLALGWLHSGAFSSVRSFSHLDILLLALESSVLGFPLLARGSARSGTFLFASGTSFLGPLLFVLDCAHCEPPLSLRSCSWVGAILALLSLSRLGSLPPLPDNALLGLPAFSKSSWCPGFAILLLRMACVGFSLLAFGYSSSDTSPSLQAMAWPGLAIPTYQRCRSDSLPLVPDSLGSGTVLPLHRVAQFDSPLLVIRMVRMDLAPLLLGETFAGAFLLLQGPAHPDAFAFLFGLVHFESSLLLQQPV